MQSKTNDSSTQQSTSAIPASNAVKNPDQWITGGEPMTGAQKSYLSTLSQETGVDVPEDLSKGDASEKINELKAIDPRLNGKQ